MGRAHDAELLCDAEFLSNQHAMTLHHLQRDLHRGSHSFGQISRDALATQARDELVLSLEVNAGLGNMIVGQPEMSKFCFVPALTIGQELPRLGNGVLRSRDQSLV